jgi:cyanophycinase
MPRGGPLFLVGGNEFLPGNEPHDRRWVEAAASGTAYVIATAAARQDPDRAVRTATAWFAGLGLSVEELPLRGRRAAAEPRSVEAAAEASGFYLCGGDPGLVVNTLEGTPTWEAIVGAWRSGAALAGSSAGAMALGEWTLLRARRPGDARRRYAPALGLVRGLAIVPHLDEFGEAWLPSALAARPRHDAVLLGIDARTAAAWLPGQGGGWTVLGAGGVEVVTPDARRRAAAGHRLTGLRPPG